MYDVYGMAGLEAGLEIGHRNKTLAEITDEFERARAKEARKRAEAKLNFRGTYGFSFSAAHLVDADIARRREALAAKRNAQLSPFVDMNVDVLADAARDRPSGWRAEGAREVLERALDVERRPGGGDDDGDAESEGEARVEV